MSDQPTKRLRVSHIIVTPVLVWDDGEELTPAPQVAPQALPASKVAGFIESLPAELLKIEAQAAEAESA